MATEDEDQYFHRLQAEQRAKLRAQLDAQAQRLAEEQHKTDLAVRIKQLGFSGQTLRIFDLLPLVHVAWADGKIQRNERARILDVLRSRGIEPGSEPFVMMESLLEHKPSQAYLEQSLEVLRESLGPERSQAIVDLCVSVADASGGILGFGETISDEERELIERIAATLGAPAKQRFHRRLQG